MATVVDASVSTRYNQALIVDLSNNISNITTPIVQVASNPASGSATPIICPRTGDNLCIEYVPASGFSGLDSFEYSVVNDVSVTEVASVSITVGELQNSGLIPSNEVLETLDSICGTQQTVQVDILCQEFNAINATAGEIPPDLREMINALSAQDAASQVTISSEMASEQLRNIGKHLASLRQGNRSSIAGLSYRHNDQYLDAAMLAKLFKSTGGSASADSNNTWGWFINGNVSGGKQDESLFEKAFDFSTTGLSAGVDYRIQDKGFVGIAAGLGNTGLDLSFNQGGTDTQGRSLILYSSMYFLQSGYLDAIFSTNYFSMDSRRRIIFGSIDDQLSADISGTATAFKLASGYDFSFFKGVSTSLALNLEYLKTTIDQYTEAGNSPFGVTIDEREIKRLNSSLGSRVSYPISTASGVWMPQLDIHLVRQFEQNATLIEGYFNSDPDRTRFRFNSNVPDRNYIQLDLGLSFVSPGGTTGFVQIGSSMSKQYYQNWTATIGYRMAL